MVIAKNVCYRIWGTYSVEINKSDLDEINRSLAQKAVNPEEIPQVTEDIIREFVERDFKSNPNFWHAQFMWKSLPWNPSDNTFYKETFAMILSEYIDELVNEGNYEDWDRDLIDEEPIYLLNE